MIDVSFISLRLVLPAVAALIAEELRIVYDLALTAALAKL